MKVIDDDNEPRNLWNCDFILLCISSVAFYTSFYALLSTLPEFVKGIAGGDVALGFIMGAFAISSLIFRPITGRALDRPGRTRFVIGGAAIFVIASSLYWFARTLPLLIAVRILHGAGMALFVTASTTIVADVTPAARRGEAMGILGVTPHPALAIGPPLGAMLATAAGFRWLFHMSAVFAVIALGLSIPVNDRLFVPLAYSERVGGIRSLLTKDVALPSLAIFATMLAYGPLISFLPVHVGITQAGLFFTVYATTISVTRVGAGRLSDLYGRHAVAYPGMGLIVLSLVLLWHSKSLPWLMATAVIYGVGMGAAQPALYALAVDMVDERRTGVALGTFSAALELGVGGGSIAAGFIVHSLGYERMFLLIGIAVAVGLAVFVVSSKQRPARA